MTIQDTPVAVIQEGTSWGMQFDLTDTDGAAEVPSIITYTVHDEKTATKIANGTIAAASSFQVPLNKTANTLVDRTQTEGTHILTVICQYADAEDTLPIVNRWKIKRTKFLS